MKRLIVLFFVLITGFSSAQKISELPEATDVDSTNLFVIVQGGVTKKLTFASLVEQIAEDSSLIIGVIPNDSLLWILNGANIYNKNSGNIGIGISTPTEKLEIDGNIKMSDGATRYITVGTSATVQGNHLVIRSGEGTFNVTDASGNIYLYTPDDDTDGNILLNVDETGSKMGGYVGIGVAVPGHPLDVDGNIRVSGSLIFTGIPERDSAQFVLATDADTTVLVTFPILNYYLKEDEASTPSVFSTFLRDTTNGYIYSHPITDNVGIGTEAPAEKLDVDGNINASGKIYAGLDSAGTAYGVYYNKSTNEFSYDSAAVSGGSGNETITLSGDVTGSGTTSIIVTVGDDSHNHTTSTLPNLVSSIDGVTNDGGNVDLVQGGIITITPDDGANTITISATEVDGSTTNEIQDLSYDKDTRVLSITGGSSGTITTDPVTNGETALATGDQIYDFVTAEMADLSLDEFIIDAKLFQSFPATIIRNREMNNLHTDSDDTRYVVTAHNTTDDYVVLNYPAPMVEGLIEIDTAYGLHRWALFADYATLIDVDSISASRDTIWYSTYVTGTGTMGIGDSVMFFNPYHSNEYLSQDPLLNNTGLTPSATYVAPGGVWQATDGTYYMIVNGWVTSTSKYRPYLATSTDLTSWSYLLTTSPYVAGTAPFDKSYISSGGHLFFTANPQKLPGSDSLYVAAFTCTKNGSSYMTVSICIFTETFDVLWVCDEEISPPGISYQYGWTSGGISYYKGDYYLSFCNRPTSSAGSTWVPYEMKISNLENLECSEVNQIITCTGQQTWNGNHIDNCSPVIYDGELYYFIGGTGIAAANFMLYLNRSYGMVKKTGNGFVQNPNNPVVLNPIEGETVWGTDLLWATDHSGGYFSYWFKDGYQYSYFAMENGADTYKVGGIKTKLKEREETTTPSASTTLTPAPTSDDSYSGIVASFTAGESVAQWEACYLKSDGKLWKADADSTIYMPALWIAAEAITANNAGTFLEYGYIRNDAWTWTVGNGMEGAIYLSTTAGAITQTPPSGTYDGIQIIGFATHADRMKFSPSPIIIEIAP